MHEATTGGVLLNAGSHLAAGEAGTADAGCRDHTLQWASKPQSSWVHPTSGSWPPEPWLPASLLPAKGFSEMISLEPVSWIQSCFVNSPSATRRSKDLFKVVRSHHRGPNILGPEPWENSGRQQSGRMRTALPNSDQPTRDAALRPEGATK